MKSFVWNGCFWWCCMFLVLGCLPGPQRCQARSADSEVTAQETSTPAGSGTSDVPRVDALEETVLMEILRIIDQKFDSLSARMSVLERSVSGLNFYSVRQFREINQNVKAIPAALAEVNSQMTRMETDGRAAKQSVAQVGRDVSALRAESSKMFEDIANSMDYANQKVEEKFAEVKVEMGRTAQAALAVAEEAGKGPSQDDMAVVIKYLEDLPRNVSCDVDFRPLAERVDLRFAEMKRQTHTHFIDLINASARSKDDREKEEREKKEEGSESRGEGDTEVDSSRVLMALANMTHSVIDAVSYLRHTAGMIERLLASTEIIADEQARLRHDVLMASGLLTSEEFVEGGVSEQEGRQEELRYTNGLDLAQEYTNELDPEVTSSESSKRDGSSTATRSGGRDLGVSTPTAGKEKQASARSSLWVKSACPLSSESFKMLDDLAKNGSHVIEVLSKLAQLSSASLTGALTSLRDEVVRLEELRARLAKDLGLSKGPAGLGGLGWNLQDMRHLHNTTKTIFNIVEAIASNTGWIPHIFRNMHHLERLTNRSVELSTHVLQEQKWSRALENEVPGSAGTRSGYGGAVTRPGEALEVIFDTNVKLRRLVPALTRLLAEPEPLVALVDGQTYIEGRVEVYYRGQWGSVCQEDMGHQEASAICRYLGYTGGISAGSSHFGKGRELQWRFNVSCLTAFRCPIVTRLSKPSDCDHDNDFSVICDHMLRMVSIPGVNDINTGRLEWHHQGFWLPICARGWSGYEARVACKQLGYRDGREFDASDMDLHEGATNRTTWVMGVGCTGVELRLDACGVESFQADHCPESGLAAGVRCQ